MNRAETGVSLIITAEMGVKDLVQSTEYMRDETHQQRWE